MKIGFIGCGQMGKMLLHSVIRAGDLHSILVTTKTKSSSKTLAEEYPVTISESNARLVNDSEVIFLCVKPDDLNAVFSEIGSLDTSDKLFITITSENAIEERLTEKTRIIKALPNTQVETGDGIILYSPGAYVKENDIEIFRNILRAAGSFVKVSDDMLKKAGKISGCGPAVIYTVIDAIIDSGIRLGLDQRLARELAIKMVIGSTKKAVITGRTMEELKREVCTPGGTTIEAIASMERAGLRGILMDAFAAAYNKSLSKGK